MRKLIHRHKWNKKPSYPSSIGYFSKRGIMFDAVYFIGRPFKCLHCSTYLFVPINKSLSTVECEKERSI